MATDGPDQLQDDDEPAGEEFTSHTAALGAALETTPYLPRDRAAVHLARRYAAMLDDAEDRLTDHAEQGQDDSRDFARVVTILAKIGPRYEAVLDRLGMSPGARPATREGDPHHVDPAATALARLQSGAGPAAEGEDHAAGIHPSVAEALADD